MLKSVKAPLTRLGFGPNETRMVPMSLGRFPPWLTKLTKPSTLYNQVWFQLLLPVFNESGISTHAQTCAGATFPLRVLLSVELQLCKKKKKVG